MARTIFSPADDMLGRYLSYDGTVEFYGRVNSLLQPQYTVLDLGAGRGAWFHDDVAPFRRSLRDVRTKVAAYIGADVDPAVMQNPTTTKNVIIGQDGHIPLTRHCVDVIICDYVLEHVADISRFEAEVSRVVKPGGYFCARTPHIWNYVSISSRLMKDAVQGKWLFRAQPKRKSEDRFPTYYRCNSLRQIRTSFTNWEDFSYLYCSEPQYFFGSEVAYYFFSMFHKLAPRILTGNIFIFLRKRKEV